MRSSNIIDKKMYIKNCCSRNNTSEINIKNSVMSFPLAGMGMKRRNFRNV
jgi:hypothetical protein